MLSGNENGTKIIYVGQRRPGDNRVAKRLKKSVSIVVFEAIGGTDAEFSRPRQSVGPEQRASDFFLAVDAVCVPRNGEYTGLAVQRDAKGQQELNVAAASTVTANGHGGFAAR